MRDGGVCSIGQGRRRCLALLGLLACTVAGITWLAAEPAGAATALEAEVGYAGTYVPGQPVPVRMRVTADRLLSGELEVAIEGPATAVPIEVPGGTAKDFLVVMATPSAARARLDVTVRLADGTRSPPSATASAAPATDQEVVGVLPGASGGRPLPGTAPLAVDAGVARFVPLGSLELERAPDTLFALGTIGVGADELARQAPAVRAGLLRWVEAGGRLLVDAAGTPVPGLPDGWQPGPDGVARAGAGEVRLTAGAMAEGRWSGLIEPTRRPTQSQVRGMGAPPIGDLLAGEAGFRLPRISWLIGFLVLYVAAVGPLLYAVLRRKRRPELAWIAIPLIAVVFTGASYAGGRSLRNATPVVHGTVLSTDAHGSTALTYLGVSSRSGGRPRLTYPPGWLAGAGAGADGTSQGSPMPSVRLTPSGSEGRLPLDAGQFAVVSARGPAALQGALEVTAGSDADGLLRGTVRNGTRLPLADVAVVSGSTMSRVGVLAAGEQRDWTLQSAAFRGGPPIESQLWGSGSPDGGEQRRLFTNVALWSAAQRAGVVLRDSGHVAAVGSTNQFVPPVKVGGRQPGAGGQTLVVGTGPVAATGMHVTDVSVRAEMVRVSGSAGRSTVVRFGLPSVGRAVDPARLVLRLPTPQAEVWTGDGWTAVTCAPPTCVPGPVVSCPPGVPCGNAPPRFAMTGPVAEFPVPAGGVENGAVYVRFGSGLPPSPPSDFMLSLREKT